jgi:hypothetical protein
MRSCANLPAQGQIRSSEQRKKQLDWLMTNADVITSQSHSSFLVRAFDRTTQPRTQAL